MPHTIPQILAYVALAVFAAIFAHIPTKDRPEDDGYRDYWHEPNHEPFDISGLGRHGDTYHAYCIRQMYAAFRALDA
jgi:hypothetical protein